MYKKLEEWYLNSLMQNNKTVRGFKKKSQREFRQGINQVSNCAKLKKFQAHHPMNAMGTIFKEDGTHTEVQKRRCRLYSKYTFRALIQYRVQLRTRPKQRDNDIKHLEKTGNVQSVY